MPTFKIETVLSVLGPDVRLSPREDIESMQEAVTGQSTADNSEPLKCGTPLNKLFVEHVLKHHTELTAYHDRGLIMHRDAFHSGNTKKVIARYAKVFGKEIEIPVIREITIRVFESLTDLNEFRNICVIESDIIGVMSDGIGFTLTYWENL